MSHWDNRSAQEKQEMDEMIDLCVLRKLEKNHSAVFDRIMRSSCTMDDRALYQEYIKMFTRYAKCRYDPGNEIVYTEAGLRSFYGLQ